MLRRGSRTWPASIIASRADRGVGVRRATGRPLSVMVIVSPWAALETTADAFCFKARIPTSDMFYKVAHLVASLGGPQRLDLSDRARPVVQDPDGLHERVHGHGADQSESLITQPSGQGA